jgi:hypothetical protein
VSAGTEAPRLWLLPLQPPCVSCKPLAVTRSDRSAPAASLLYLHQRGRQRTEENERPCFTVDLFGEMRTLLVSFRIVKESFEIAKNRDGAERSLRWCQDNAPLLL